MFTCIACRKTPDSICAYKKIKSSTKEDHYTEILSGYDTAHFNAPTHLGRPDLHLLSVHPVFGNYNSSSNSKHCPTTPYRVLPLVSSRAPKHSLPIDQTIYLTAFHIRPHCVLVRVARVLAARKGDALGSEFRRCNAALPAFRKKPPRLRRRYPTIEDSVCTFLIAFFHFIRTWVFRSTRFGGGGSFGAGAKRNTKPMGSESPPRKMHCVHWSTVSGVHPTHEPPYSIRPYCMTNVKSITATKSLFFVIPENTLNSPPILREFTSLNT